MNHDEILKLTQEYGGRWAVCHAERILANIAAIAEGDSYDAETVWIAAHLHDWGGYAKWAQPGVDHLIRSMQVVPDFLAERSCPPDLAKAIMECIEFHHGGPSGRSIESVLFTDADALDLLGAVGFARVFAMNYRNLEGGVVALKRYRDMSDAAITLPSTRRIAKPRIDELNAILASFESQTAGIY
jgi:HD superfamily phosphodiesterase